MYIYWIRLSGNQYDSNKSGTATASSGVSYISERSQAFFVFFFLKMYLIMYANKEFGSVNEMSQISQPSYKKIAILDTTLRDGEQAPGATLQWDQKIALAERLQALGVDVLEPGFPISSPGEFEAVQKIARTFQQFEICGFARAVKIDIEAAAKATEDAVNRRIHLFLSSSDIHLQHQLRKTRAETVQIAHDMVSFAKQFTDRVQFTAMDASRTAIDDLIEMVEVAIAAGATIINLPDTVGYALPDEYGQMFRAVRQGARGAENVQLSAHCHNDLGLAVANSLAAVQAGADQVEVTVNGVGERTGNCALEELVMAIETRRNSLDVTTNIRAEALYEISHEVSRAMRFPVAYNKPVIGRNAFRHESGIHQDGLLKDLSTYEIMSPERLGIPRTMIILGKHSGRHALSNRLAQYDIYPEEQQLHQWYEDFKKYADHKHHVTDEELLMLTGNSNAITQSQLSIEDIQWNAHSDGTIASKVTLNSHDHPYTTQSIAIGAMQSVMNSLQQAVQQYMSQEMIEHSEDEIEGIQLEDMEMQSFYTNGIAYTDAVATICYQKQTFRGTASGQDSLQTAAIAFVSACNQAFTETIRMKNDLSRC